METQTEKDGSIPLLCWLPRLDCSSVHTKWQENHASRRSSCQI